MNKYLNTFFQNKKLCPWTNFNWLHDLKSAKTQGVKLETEAKNIIKKLQIGQKNKTISLKFHQFHLNKIIFEMATYIIKHISHSLLLYWSLENVLLQRIDFFFMF